jgi:hypothetical protein
MKTQMKQFMGKIDFWNLFIGVILGFGAGIWVINALVPNADQMIRMYRLDQKSVTEDKQFGGTTKLEGYLEVERKQ